MVGNRKTPGKRLAGQSRDALVTGLSFSPDGLRSATAAKGRGVVVWDPASARPLLTLQKEGRRRLEVPTDTVTVAYSPDGRHLATGHARGGVTIWEAEGKELFTWEPGKAGVTAVAWSRDGRYVAAGADNGRVSLLDFEARREIAGVGARPEKRGGTDRRFFPGRDHAGHQRRGDRRDLGF